MKKTLSVLICMAIVLSLSGCGRTMDDIIAKEPCISGTVGSVMESAILVDTEDGKQYHVSLKVLNADSSTHFSVGDRVNVYYDGTVLETFPMQILTVYAITLQEPAVREKSLQEQGLEVIALMAEMARSDRYMAAYTQSPDLQQIIAPAASGKYGTPDKVYAITLPQEVLDALVSSMGMDGLSPELLEYTQARCCAVIPTQLNATEGASVLAASSICTAGKTFVSTELSENTIYLYTFPTGLPVLVTFTGGEGGAVSASGTFLFRQGLDFPSEQSVADLFYQVLEVTVSVSVIFQ